MNQSRPGGKLVFTSVSAAVDGRWSNRPSRFDRRVRDRRRDDETGAERERQSPHSRQPLFDLGDGATADEQQPDAAEREDDAGVHATTDAVQGRTERT